ncbi:MAG TPA: XRE family transcriptional regulator [Rhizobacter sp.]|nr:XRE family transcriptional regulator [Rhizobacter sp.]
MLEQDELHADLDINARIARRVRELRQARGLTLEQLSERCGVSRSMISVVERGESSPTASLLDKLCAGLGTSLNALFEAPQPEAASPLVRRDAQPQWRDPASGYVRRSLSPPGVDSPIQMVEVSFPPGAHVSYDNSLRVGVHQQVWLMEGVIEVTTGTTTHRLAEGDCLAMRLDAPSAFRNPSRKRARYIVVLTTP